MTLFWLTWIIEDYELRPCTKFGWYSLSRAVPVKFDWISRTSPSPASHSLKCVYSAPQPVNYTAFFYICNLWSGWCRISWAFWVTVAGAACLLVCSLLALKSPRKHGGYQRAPTMILARTWSTSLDRRSSRTLKTDDRLRALTFWDSDKIYIDYYIMSSVSHLPLICTITLIAITPHARWNVPFSHLNVTFILEGNLG